jgi:hypothetical protein
MQMLKVILYLSLTVAVDFTALSVNFTFLVYFIGKIVICSDGDSNSRPYGLIFGIKTPKTAF